MKKIGIMVVVFIIYQSLSFGNESEKKVVVPGLHAYKGITEGVPEVLADLLLEALLSRHGIRALGPSDIRTVLSAEQQKKLMERSNILSPVPMTRQCISSRAIWRHCI